MNKWFRRAVGTVGVAGGMLLLGSGTAHADDAAPTAGALDDLMSPAGDLAAFGPDNLGVTLDTPGARWSAGNVDGGPFAFGPNNGEVGATLHVPGEHGQTRDVFAGGRLPDLLRALPAQDFLPARSLLPGKAVGLPSPTTGDGLVPSGGPGPTSGAAPLRQTGTDAVHTRPAGQHTEALPTINGLPLVGGQLPVLTGQGLPPLDAASVRGALHPVDDLTVPVGGQPTEADVPLLRDVPLVGDVLQNNSIQGLPSLPEGLGSYLPRHASTDTEALPVVGGLLSGLPLVGNLLAGGGGLLGQ